MHEAPAAGADRLRLTRPHLLTLLALFVVSRAAAYAAGVRFTSATLIDGWQMIDPQLLRHDLGRSLWNLHSQPPLFNLFLGAVLHLPDSWQRPAFVGTYWLFGLVLAWSLATLMAELGVRPWIATVTAGVFIVGPAALLYESWLFYTYPVATLLALGAVLLLRYLRGGRLRTGLGLFACLAAVCLIRSSYHLVWLLAAVVLVTLARRASWQRVLAAAALPVVLVTGLYVKNLVLFHSFSASSWFGMTVSLETTFTMPLAEREQLVAEGKLSRYALIPPFAPPSSYSAEFAATKPTGVPVRDEAYKSNGAINYNAEPYIAIDRHYLADALEAVRLRPWTTARGALETFRTFVKPAADYRFLRPNARALGWWYPAYLDVVELRPGQHGASTGLYPSSRPSLTVAATYLLAIATTIGAAAVLWRRRRTITDPARLVTLLFLGGTVMFVTVLSAVVDVGENNRFRFEVDPLALTLAAVGLTTAWRHLRERRAHADVPTPADVAAELDAVAT